MSVITSDCRIWLPNDDLRNNQGAGTVRTAMVMDLDSISTALGSQPGVAFDSAEKRASTALILRGGAVGPELFLIRRAEAPDDPWSGHMAFPGGRVEDDDADLAATAIRETREETGLVLDAGMQIGRLDDVQGRSRGRSIGLVISCFVFAIDATASDAISANYEVASTHWVPLAWFDEVERYRRYEPRPPHSGVYPGVQIGTDSREILWGLTYRFSCDFFQRLGKSLPQTSDQIAT